MKRLLIIVAVILFVGAAQWMTTVSGADKQTDYFERVAGRPA